MVSSLRKPYLRWDSPRTFFRSPARALEMSRTEESVLEKPYVQSNYNQMHLDPPTPGISLIDPSTIGGSAPAVVTGKVICSYIDNACEYGIHCIADVSLGGPDDTLMGYLPLNVTDGGVVSSTVSGSQGQRIDIELDPTKNTHTIEVAFKDGWGNTYSNLINLTCTLWVLGKSFFFSSIQWVLDMTTKDGVIHVVGVRWNTGTGMFDLYYGYSLVEANSWTEELVEAGIGVYPGKGFIFLDSSDNVWILKWFVDADSSPSALSRITYGYNNSGAGWGKEVVSGEDIGQNYSWTPSPSYPGTYYLTGGIVKPQDVYCNDVEMLYSPGDFNITSSEWAYGDGDGLGYSTVYVNTPGDPDVLAAGYVVAGILAPLEDAAIDSSGNIHAVFEGGTYVGYAVRSGGSYSWETLRTSSSSDFQNCLVVESGGTAYVHYIDTSGGIDLRESSGSFGSWSDVSTGLTLDVLASVTSHRTATTTYLTYLSGRGDLSLNIASKVGAGSWNSVNTGVLSITTTILEFFDGPSGAVLLLLFGYKGTSNFIIEVTNETGSWLRDEEEMSVFYPDLQFYPVLFYYNSLNNMGYVAYPTNELSTGTQNYPALWRYAKKLVF